MLEANGGAIYETGGGGGYQECETTSGLIGGYAGNSFTYVPSVWWNTYPVYVCTDKTKKAIEVLKTLQAEKLITCNSVPKFIELVEKIAGLL